MNRRFSPALASLALIAACSTDLTAPGMSASTARADANGVSNPGTPVNASFVVHVEGEAYYRESGASNNGNGTCTTGGAYYNPSTKKTSGKEHPQCLSSTSGIDIEVTFQEIANYVLSTSGNHQLNFTPTCSTDELGATTCTPNGIQYKKNGDLTVGFGGLSATDTDGRAWTIDFAQPWVNGVSSNLIASPGRTVALKACNETLGCWPGAMTW